MGKSRDLLQSIALKHQTTMGRNPLHSLGRTALLIRPIDKRWMAGFSVTNDTSLVGPHNRLMVIVDPKSDQGFEHLEGFPKVLSAAGFPKSSPLAAPWRLFACDRCYCHRCKVITMPSSKSNTAGRSFLVTVKATAQGRASCLSGSRDG